MRRTVKGECHVESYTLPFLDYKFCQARQFGIFATIYPWQIRMIKKLVNEALARISDRLELRAGRVYNSREAVYDYADLLRARVCVYRLAKMALVLAQIGREAMYAHRRGWESVLEISRM